MKKQSLYFLSLCAIAAISLCACDDENASSKKCKVSSDCGDTSIYYCSAQGRTCELLVPAHCINGKKDADETDVDCGGSCVTDVDSNNHEPMTCGMDKGCQLDSDCASMSCESGFCKAKGCTGDGDGECPTANNGRCDVATSMCISCGDGLTNGDETDVDCGGTTCATRCEIGKKCSVATDCLSGLCTSGVCEKGDFDVADPEKLFINEAFDAAKSSPVFSLNDDVTACEFVEIANVEDKAYQLDGLTLSVVRTDKAASYEIPLSGIIQPKSILVIHNCDSLPLPSGVVGLKSTTLAFVGGGTYEMAIQNDAYKGGVATVKFSQQSTSYNRATDFEPNTDFIKLTDSADKYAAKATPGYCQNGGLLAEDCATHCANQVKDADEIGVDCGGSICPKCDANTECQAYTDCLSGYCLKGTHKDDSGVDKLDEYGICTKCTEDSQCTGTNMHCDVETGACYKEGTCSDGTVNQDESDVDCGGICGPTCKVGASCVLASDCLSGVCENDVCSGTDPEKGDVTKLIINEVYDNNGAPSGTVFGLNGDRAPCEFVEIANPTEARVSLDGIYLVRSESSSTGIKYTSIALSGALNAKNLLVVHTCGDSLTLPSDAWGYQAYKTSSLVTNEKDLGFFLSDASVSTSIDGVKTSKAFDYKAANSGVSSLNRDPDFDDSGVIKATTEMAGYAAIATPGYCVNGGLYSLNCLSHCDDNELNEDETDLNCGGKQCSPCAENKSCLVDTDCESGTCGSDKKCVKCTSNSDCQTDLCDTNSGKCLEPDVVDVDKLVINEVFVKGSASPNFEHNGGVAPCMFVEIAYTGDTSASLNGVTLTLTKDTGTVNLPLSGYVKPKNLIVVHKCAELDLPSDAVGIYSDSCSITQSKEYTATIWSEAKTNEDAFKTTSDVKTSLNRDPEFEKSSEFKREAPTPGYCKNGGRYSENCEVQCANTEAQCGGLCDKCANGVACTADADCASGNCGDQNKCVAATCSDSSPCAVGTCNSGICETCFDGVKNQNETDVDCGGSCGATCVNEKSCTSASDCVFWECTSGVCSGSAPVQATLSDLIINEVMGSPKTGEKFTVKKSAEDTGVTVSEKQCEFVEIVNKSSNKIDVSGITLELYKDSASEASKEIALQAIVPASGVLVVSECESMTLPADAVHQKATIAMTNGSTYILKLRQDDAEASAVSRAAVSTPTGKSQVRATDRTDASSSTDGVETLKMHDTVSNSVNHHSPGYCVNGTLFSSNCAS